MYNVYTTHVTKKAWQEVSPGPNTDDLNRQPGIQTKNNEPPKNHPF